MRAVEYYLGLDLGQRKSYTALALIERAVDREQYRNPVSFALEWEELSQPSIVLRHLERFPLGTSYVDVVDRVKSMVWGDTLRGHTRLIVDATGAGAPIVDLFRRDKELPRACQLAAVTITSGSSVAKGPKPGDWQVPRQDLISGLALLFEERRLTISRGLPEARQFIEELVRFGLDESYCDDLVFATSLACWMMRRDHFDDKPRGPRTPKERAEVDEILGAIMGVSGKRYRE